MELMRASRIFSGELIGMVALALASASAHAQSPASAPPRGTIAGEVVDAGTLQPLRGATVVVLPGPIAVLPPVASTGSSFASQVRGVALEAAPAQDTTAAERTFILEGRVGASGGIGGSRSLLKLDASTGVTFAFQLSRHWWGWTSADYRSDVGSIRFGGDGSPAVELYTLIGGVSRTFGLAFLPSRWRPFEIGVGIGSTQSEIVATANLSAARLSAMSGEPSIPADAALEPVYGTQLWSSTR